jgi:diguanylate cyclase (GGDEF)-like protein
MRAPVAEHVRPPAPVAEPERLPAAPGTDAGWLEYLEPRLEAELSRAESSDMDLSLARLRLDEPHVDERLSLVIAEVTRIIRESFPLHDMIFESGDDSCTILIPDVEIDAAVHSLDDIRKRISSTPLEGKRRTISVGVSSRAGRLIDARTLLEEADVSLSKATREGGDQVMGFRADAARFRESLTGSRT